MGTKTKRFLLVDDDRDALAPVQAALGDLGTVDHAQNWLDAKARLQETRYRAVILDLLLPDVEDVLTPLRTIHEIDLDYPVLFTTASPEVADRLMDRIQRLGANRVLSKPFDPDTLHDALSALLAEHPGR